jgi:hypothetical protein
MTYGEGSYISGATSTSLFYAKCLTGRSQWCDGCERCHNLGDNISSLLSDRISDARRTRISGRNCFSSVPDSFRQKPRFYAIVYAWYQKLATRNSICSEEAIDLLNALPTSRATQAMNQSTHRVITSSRLSPKQTYKPLPYRLSTIVR